MCMLVGSLDEKLDLVRSWIWLCAEGLDCMWCLEKGWWWGRGELEVSGNAFVTEHLSTDVCSRNCYLHFMQDMKPVGEIVFSLCAGNGASPGEGTVGVRNSMKYTVDKLAFNDWQALLKHAWDMQIEIKQELKLSGRAFQVTDSSPCFYRDHIP